MSGGVSTFTHSRVPWSSLPSAAVVAAAPRSRNYYTTLPPPLRSPLSALPLTTLLPTDIDSLWRHTREGWGNREVQTRYEIQFYCFFVVSPPSCARPLPPPRYLNTPPTPTPPPPPLATAFPIYCVSRIDYARTLAPAYITLIITTYFPRPLFSCSVITINSPAFFYPMKIFFKQLLLLLAIVVCCYRVYTATDNVQANRQWR